MLYLAFILATSLLLAGFIALTHYETAHGVRYFAARRDAFDAAVERVEFILEHVDLAAFFREEARRMMTATGHVVATLSLQAVRSVERVLTRLVRHLRTQHDSAQALPQESTREFVRTLSDFKGTLKTTYQPIPEAE